jgi:ABC-type uncharacterized transport system ATPase subunit
MALAANLRHITKTFGSRVALSGADFSLAWGEVHALLGENGAGKSSLMNVLSGFYTVDAGIVEINGRPMQFKSPVEAIRAGVGMIHQHFKLVGALSAIENIRLVCERRAGWRTQAQAQLAMEKVAGELGFKINPATLVDDLAVSDRQKLEILKVLLAGGKILIKDEPTAILTESEAKTTLSLTRQLAQSGHAVVLITHKLRDVLGYSDRVTVMRGGKTTLDGVSSSGMDAESLSRAMTGTQPVAPTPRRVHHSEREALRLNKVSAAAKEHGIPLREISLTVRGGEILGIAGVGGNGQTELVETVIGLRRHTGGDIMIEGRTAPASPMARREAGLRIIPADRMGTGLFGDLAVDVNVSLPRLLGYKPEKRFLVQKKWMEDLAQTAIRDFEIAGAVPETPVRLLSGGNAQKLMLAREFVGHFSILIAHSPTRGLDVRAIRAVQTRLRSSAEMNVAVVLISEDLDEVLELSDRVAVMSHGRLSEAEPIDQIDRGRIGRLMLEMQ